MSPAESPGRHRPLAGGRGRSWSRTLGVTPNFRHPPPVLQDSRGTAHAKQKPAPSCEGYMGHRVARGQREEVPAEETAHVGGEAGEASNS